MQTPIWVWSPQVLVYQIPYIFEPRPYEAENPTSYFDVPGGWGGDALFACESRRPGRTELRKKQKESPCQRAQSTLPPCVLFLICLPLLFACVLACVLVCLLCTCVFGCLFCWLLDCLLFLFVSVFRST